MGASEEEEAVTSTDDIPRIWFENIPPFWISVDAISNKQWASYISPRENIEGTGNCPVSVRWIKAMAFCKKLNTQFKETLPKGYHFSLPTECQWEYAARSGGDSILHECYKNCTPKLSWPDHYYVTPAGDEEIEGIFPNKFGILNMLGDPGEWVFDMAAFHLDEMHNGIYQGDDYILGTIEGGEQRVVKGRLVSSAFREFALRGEEINFRVALRKIRTYDLNDETVLEEDLIPKFLL